MEDGVEAEHPETRRPGDQLGGCSKEFWQQEMRAGRWAGGRLGGGRWEAGWTARRGECAGGILCVRGWLTAEAFNLGSSFT